MSDTKLRSSVYQKKLKSSGNFAPQTSSQLRCYLRMAQRRPPSKCWATAAGAERLAARVCARGQILRGLEGPGEVTSPLFSINSLLNANWYQIGIIALFDLQGCKSTFFHLSSASNIIRIPGRESQRSDEQGICDNLIAQFGQNKMLNLPPGQNGAH